MAIHVKGEVIVPDSKQGTYLDIYENYTHTQGLRRARHIITVGEDDFYNGHTVCYSEDNGETWGPEQDVYGEDFIAAPDGSWEILNHGMYNVYNPIHRHFIGINMERIFKGGREAAYDAYWRKCKMEWSDHCYLTVRGENEEEMSSSFIEYEPCAAFDPANPLNEEYFYKNVTVFSDPYITKNGDVLLALGAPMPTCCRILGIDVQKIFPSCPDITFALIVCRGVWNGRNYELTFSLPVVISDLQSSRGIDEPVAVELDSGRILVVFRGSNAQSAYWNTRIEPGTPGFKWYCYSDDGGKTFTPPAPWHFDDGEVIYSSATISHFIRSSRNNKLYWIGNITDHRVNGNYPRYPLQIVEVDEKYGTAKKESLTVIDTRRDWESDLMQLSNFSILEDRETGDIELWLAKIGQYGEDWKRAETWKYKICLN